MRYGKIFLLTTFAAFVACSQKDVNGSKKSEVRKVAEEAMYYRMEGDVDAYLSMMLDFDSLPAPYRSQLRTMMQQHFRQDSLRHGILTSAKVVSDTVLSANRAEAYVELLWNDTLKERILLCFERKDEQWWLK